MSETGTVPPAVRRALPYRPGDVCWRVLREPVQNLGAAPLLLLQVTHPLVAAGVEQFSDYESDPFGRLWRTADIMLKMAFGDPEVSRRQSEKFRRIHQRVQGTSDEGVPYRALDPDLLMWVWATGVKGALDLYERTFGRLPDEDRARYYEEQKLLAHACWVPEGHCPEDLAAFEEYFDHVVRTELRPTVVSDKLLRRHPESLQTPLPKPVDAAYLRLNILAAGALLPKPLRERLGIPWSPARARAFAALLAAHRAGARVVPEKVRHGPVDYLVARKRPLQLLRTPPERRRRKPGDRSAA
ncbi:MULTISPECIES: oxygenase MpaB family protein [Thermomonospora]|uniref:ER-bound oxygenase mpaB/mpaB'/Rubber oxygenase catalytic domain-containing protein n=1 Tax=Thermomonospora curvata (strain ATCC 19995 / DSM 43183 / JCM 3096 / KCTC 9072 / NBRC 15933 / NCIMB 10081 / Henssen B9) TaxID=471852 RepID=D1A9V5_THECD|nr:MULTISPECIES: oxygenase MpaB family protein [Thermomonospora]ACY96891.1 conserved hypothetical protein [Thermomonospora curvata DSM 43183]PKK15176.1 MAG: DUF2236 domain-containing protein [Thermomonospora sp. CIF 1]